MGSENNMVAANEREEIAYIIRSETDYDHPDQGHYLRAADRILARLASAQPDGQQGEAERMTKRITEVIDEDGGCWVACSGCQEGVDGYVSSKDYPYSPLFKCQPGGGCHECGGIGVLWWSGAYLSSYGDIPYNDGTTPEAQQQHEEWRGSLREAKND